MDMNTPTRSFPTCLEAAVQRAIETHNSSTANPGVSSVARKAYRCDCDIRSQTSVIPMIAGHCDTAHGAYLPLTSIRRSESV